MNKGFSKSEIKRLGLEETVADRKPKKPKRNYKQSAQNYIALALVIAVFVGLGLTVKYQDMSFTLGPEALIVVVIFVGAWVSKVFYEAIR